MNRRPGAQPGNPGAVPGHAPTNVRGTVANLTPEGRALNMPYRFGQPGIDPNQPRGGRPATAAQRFCMEAVQKISDLNNKAEVKAALKRFPPGMVKRFVALQKAAENPDCPFFLQAQRQIYAILIAPVRKEEKAEEMAARASEPIEVRVGRLEVPMPGAPGDVPPSAETKVG